MSFPSPPVATIMEILDQYGVEPHETERERVQLAILKLSEGDETKLLSYVEAAKEDYRDVLSWADHPEEASPEGVLENEEFREDWRFEGFAAAARASLAPPKDGECSSFKMWPILGRRLHTE